MIRFLLLAAAAPLAIATPAAAQNMGTMPGMNMPGMTHPAHPGHRPPVARPAPHATSPRASRASRHGPARAARRRAAPHQAAPAPAHDMSTMPGMQMPGPASGAAQPQHDMSTMPGMQMPAGHDHAGPTVHDSPAIPAAQMAPGQAPAHDMSSMAGHDMAATGEPASDPPAAPPPPASLQGPIHAADVYYAADRMDDARAIFRAEHGVIRTHRVLIDQLEARIRNGRDGYAWDAEAWYGGAIDRLWIKTEGEGSFGRGPEQAEVQALWSRAVDPWFNLQAGIRYDFRPDPRRAYLVLGLEGLAPYRVEVDGALFLSNKGDLSARLEAEYEQRITQRLILQPRLDLDLSLQDVPELLTGSGLSTAEAGLRLRYEIVPEFAPYVGLHYERAFGDTARFRRIAGEDRGGWAFLLGVRTWF